MASGQRSKAKETFWRKICRRQKSSGLTVRAFCAREKLSEPSFYAWRRELQKRDVEENTRKELGPLIPVTLLETVNDSNQAVEIVTPGGTTLRVQPDLPPHQLQALLAAVRHSEEPSC